MLDNNNGAGNCGCEPASNGPSTRTSFKSQFYAFNAQRHWFNNEVNAFNAVDGLVDRERFFVAHDQKLYGNVTDLTTNSNIAGMDNRAVVALASSSLQFDSKQSDNFPFDQVELVNPVRGLYGPLITKNFFTHLDNLSLSFEDRLKVTRTFALVGGVRLEHIRWTPATDVTARSCQRQLPFSRPGARHGPFSYTTWEAIPMTL